jgi:ABC-type Fe3+/spermidine/putrescine transport system ATPase subunit
MTFMSRVSNALEMAGVSKSFGSVMAVDNISFAVPRGKITCLLGPSGCGKTTTLRLIAGFEFPDHGVVSVDGRTMTKERPYERNVGLLFQDYALFPHMTVAENISYGLKHRGFPKDQVQTRSRQMLDLVKLAGLERRYPNQLSGGQQQRVALARALAPNPAILLLDEPLSALDAKLRDRLRVELKDILAAVNTTTIASLQPVRGGLCRAIQLDGRRNRRPGVLDPHRGQAGKWRNHPLTQRRTPDRQAL